MNPKITDWRGMRVWLLGASSGIGAALARELATRGARLALSARDEDRLRQLGIVGAACIACDATGPAKVAAARDSALAALGGLDLAIYLAGDYRPMSADELDAAEIERQVAVNFTGAAHFAAATLPALRRGTAGTPRGLVLVASVAAYRGLPRALAYGPGKAALAHFAEILHLELAGPELGIWLVSPGFVATRLTAQNDFAMPALLTPEEAARLTVDGLARGRFEIHYPRRFTLFLKLLRLLPYGLYFPLLRRLTRGSR